MQFICLFFNILSHFIFLYPGFVQHIDANPAVVFSSLQLQPRDNDGVDDGHYHQRQPCLLMTSLWPQHINANVPLCAFFFNL